MGTKTHDKKPQPEFVLIIVVVLTCSELIIKMKKQENWSFENPAKI